MIDRYVIVSVNVNAPDLQRWMAGRSDSHQHRQSNAGVRRRPTHRQYSVHQRDTALPPRTHHIASSAPRHWRHCSQGGRHSALTPTRSAADHPRTGTQTTGTSRGSGARLRGPRSRRRRHSEARTTRQRCRHHSAPDQHTHTHTRAMLTIDVNKS